MSGNSIWQVDIEKQLGTEYWTNVYHVLAGSQGSAKITGDEIVAAEKSFHNSLIGFTKMRVRPYPSQGAQGTIFPLTGNGAYASPQYLPLFCTANVIGAVPIGRPCRKYYRCGIDEALQAGGSLTTQGIDFFTTNLIQLNAIEELCDESGQLIDTWTIYPQVGMRQLRRGSKRRVQPVI